MLENGENILPAAAGWHNDIQYTDNGGSKHPGVNDQSRLIQNHVPKACAPDNKDSDPDGAIDIYVSALKVSWNWTQQRLSSQHLLEDFN